MSETVRRYLKDLVIAEGHSLKGLSQQLGKNHAYLQQYIERGVPQYLPDRTRRKLAGLLGISEAKLLDDDDEQGRHPALTKNVGRAGPKSSEAADLRAWKLYLTLRDARLPADKLTAENASLLFKECLELAFKA